MSQLCEIKIRWYVASVSFSDGKTPRRTFKLNDLTLLDDIKDEIHYLLPYGDKRKVVKLEYRSPSVDNEGNVVFNKVELKNQDDVMAMWRTFFGFEEKYPLGFEATVRRTVDEILKMCKRPPGY